MKFKALVLIALVVLALCAYYNTTQHVPEMTVPTQAIVQQYYSSSQRALDAIGEGTPNKEQ